MLICVVCASQGEGVTLDFNGDPIEVCEYCDGPLREMTPRDEIDAWLYEDIDSPEDYF